MTHQAKITTRELLEQKRKSLMQNGGIDNPRRRKRYHRIAAKFFKQDKSRQKFYKLHRRGSMSGRIY
jgi:hypothetical protein